MRIILTTLLILVSSYGFSSDNSTLKFSTEKVRGMWFVCATQFQVVAPNIPQLERVRLCDCYVDHIRANYTSEQIVTNGNNSMRMSQKEYNKLSKELKSICNPNTQKLEELT